MDVEQPRVLLCVDPPGEELSPKNSDGHRWESEEGEQLTDVGQGHIPSGLIRFKQELAF